MGGLNVVVVIQFNLEIPGFRLIKESFYFYFHLSIYFKAKMQQLLMMLWSSISMCMCVCLYNHRCEWDKGTYNSLVQSTFSLNHSHLKIDQSWIMRMKKWCWYNNDNDNVNDIDNDSKTVKPKSHTITLLWWKFKDK